VKSTVGFPGLSINGSHSSSAGILFISAAPLADRKTGVNCRRNSGLASKKFASLEFVHRRLPPHPYGFALSVIQNAARGCRRPNSAFPALKTPCAYINTAPHNDR